MPQVKITKTTTCKIEYDIIGEFVVVNSLVPKSFNPHGHIVTLDWFEEQRAKKRGWQFLMKIPTQFVTLCVASAKYFKAYEDGLHWETKWEERYVNPINYLREHNTIKLATRLIRDNTGMDGWFHDIHGNVVWSRLHFGEVDSPFSTSLYDLEKLIQLMNKWKDKDGTRLVNPRIVEVFYMNAEHPGERRLMFEVEPSQKLFKAIAKDYRGSFRSMYCEKKTVQLSRAWFAHTFKDALLKLTPMQQYVKDIF